MTTAINLTLGQRQLLTRFAAGELNETTSSELKELLEQFIHGELADSQGEQLMAIIGENEGCLDVLDTLWLQQPVSAVLVDAPRLDAETAVRMQHRLVQRLHRSNLSAAVLKMGTKGFLTVAAGLLRPVLGSSHTKTRQRRPR